MEAGEDPIPRRFQVKRTLLSSLSSLHRAPSRHALPTLRKSRLDF